jgi:hypothetical protein
VIGLVTPAAAEASPEDRLDCALAGAGIIVKTAATTNAGNIARQIIALAGRLPDEPARHLATPPQPANDTCDSELHLHNRIVSPCFDIGSASPISSTRHSRPAQGRAT